MFASIDIGGTNVALAVGSGDGEVLSRQSIPTRSADGPDAVLDRVGEAILALSEQAGGTPVAAGVGVPGLADLDSGHTLFLPNMPGKWRDVPVGPVLSRRLGCPVRLLNDVRLATLGELTFGRGKGVRDMVFFAVGTGIGGGVVLDGRLRLGRWGSAGELGHQTILPDGPMCGCGSRGCLEALASGPAIAAEGVRLMRIGLAPRLHEIVQGNAGAVTTREMSAAADTGDDAIRGAIERAGFWLGLGVANVVTVLHPELVVLGGGVPAIGPVFMEAVRRTVKDRVRMFPVDDVRVERSALGDEAGIYGGLALARSAADEDRRGSWNTHTAT